MLKKQFYQRSNKVPNHIQIRLFYLENLFSLKKDISIVTFLDTIKITYV
ncbi:hypothetical protein LCGC14_0578730 [marine sediment metagenome]|uniref:Uncharacterized protein n=1 Tax=marine sediment metagenome TaxID=412755 RepID=A0A0F9UQE1_9ZZZZ